MYTNIVGLYCTWNDMNRAMRVKWVELAIEQSGDDFDEALSKIVQPVE